MKLPKAEQVISNEKGTAFKFAGGMLVNILSVSMPADEWYKIVYFPVPFMDRGYSVVATNIYSYQKGVDWTVTANTGEYMALYPEGSLEYQRDAFVIAVGRWK